MSCECHQIGGRFIAEDPDCPAHGTLAQQRQRIEEQEAAEAAQRTADLEQRVQELETLVQELRAELAARNKA